MSIAISSLDDVWMKVKVLEVWQGRISAVRDTERTPPVMYANAHILLKENAKNIEGRKIARVVLFSAFETIPLDDDFVMRRVSLEGRDPHDPENPYSRGRALVKSIWFDDPTNPDSSSHLGLVQYDAGYLNDDGFALIMEELKL